MQSTGRLVHRTSQADRPSGRRARAAAARCFLAVAAAAGAVRPAVADDAPPPEVPGRAGLPDAESPPDLAPPEALRFDAAGLRWRMGAYAALDLTHRGHRTNDPSLRDVSLSAARPILEAWGERVTVRVEGDAIGVDTPQHLYEAWIGWQASRNAPRFSIGQFRVALGSEFATHEGDLPYLGYGFTSQLDGRHDVGARVDGTLTEGLWYQAAAVAGHGFNLEGERLHSPQASLRVEVAPFRLGDPDAGSAGGAQGFHVGVAYAARGSGKDPVLAATPAQTPVFRTGRVEIDGGRWVHFDAGWGSGPIRIGFEKVFGRVDDVEDRSGGSADHDNLRAYSLFARWNLTGDDGVRREGSWATGPGPSPQSCSCLPAGTWEVAGRFSVGTFGRDFFNDGLAATGGPSTWQAMTYTAGIFWEPTPNTRIGFECVKTVTEDALAAFGGTKRDTTFILRLEMQF